MRGQYVQPVPREEPNKPVRNSDRIDTIMPPLDSSALSCAHLNTTKHLMSNGQGAVNVTACHDCNKIVDAECIHRLAGEIMGSRTCLLCDAPMPWHESRGK